MKRLPPLIARFRADESAVTAVEYGVLASMFAIALLAGFRLMERSITSMFGFLSEEFGRH